MSQSRPAAIRLFVYSDSLEYFPVALAAVLAHTPREQIELRLGFSQAPHNCYYALGTLSPEGVTPARHELPGAVEHFQWTANGGLPVRVWLSAGPLAPRELARLVYHDLPLTTEYAVALAETTAVEAGWWEALAPLLRQRVDYIGSPHWVDYTPQQAEWLQAHPRYLGVPFERREGRLGVSFMAGGFVAVRSERLREANYPVPGVAWKDGPPPGDVGDPLLGEIARQLGWSRAAHAQHVQALTAC
jgi:hypothetical protein